MPNPFENSEPGESWVIRIPRWDGSTAVWRAAVVEIDGEKVVAIEHDAYSTTETFPWTMPLWQTATFEKVGTRGGK